MKIKRFEDIEACPPRLTRSRPACLALQSIAGRWRAGMQGESRRGTAVRGFISYFKRYEEECKATNRESPFHRETLNRTTRVLTINLSQKHKYMID